MGKICNVVNLPGDGIPIDPYTSTPQMDGTGDAGSSADYARGDHVHPSDTSKQSVTLSSPITVDETAETTVEGTLSALNTAKANSSALASVAFSGNYADVSGTPTLGTAAALNVASSGDASSSEVVKGDDSRLTDARPSSDVTDTYSASGTVPVSGTAVNAALGTLDVTGDSSVAASKTLASWSETDGKVSITTQDISITKSQVSDFPTIPTVTDTYSGTSSDAMSGKAVKSAIDALDVIGDSSVAASKTIASWSETDGKVSVTTQDISITKSQISDFPTIPTVTDTYSGTSSDAMSGKAVKSAIDALDGTVSGSAGTGKTLSAFSQTDGVVSATFSDISITKSQVSDFPSVDTTVTSGSSNLITSGAVYTAIDNLPEPMVFKGSLGTGGTITDLPTASTSNEGYTYKVITDGTYATLVCHVGDVVVSNGTEWVLLPAGQTDTDTWRNIKVNGTEQLGNGISSGAVDFVNGTNTTVAFDSSGNKISVSVPTVSSSSAGVAPQGSTVSTQDQTTKFLREDGSWSAPSYTTDTNTTYTFEGGTNKITVTPSGGSAQDVTITPSIANNVTGSGTSGSLTKFNGANTVTDGPALSAAISSQDQTTKFLREDGTWSAPSYTTDTNTTYSLAAGTGGDADKIVLTPSSGTADKITVPYATNAGTVNGKTVASNVPADAVFTDTTYESKAAVQGGTDVSLVTTGEKYTWNSKADTSAIPSAYTSTPAMDGTGSAGSSTAFAKGDHVHPSDTTKMTVGVDYVTAGQKSGTTLGTKATAEGNDNTASGNYSHAEGRNTKATGTYSHAEGFNTTASAQNAHAEGYSSVASHAYSHAEGTSTKTGTTDQHVQGRFNIGKSTTAFEIGNGTANNARSNAFEVETDGDVIAAGEITDGGNNTLSDKYDATSLVFRNVSYTITASNWSSTQTGGYYTYTLTTDAFNTYSGVTMSCPDNATSAQKAAYSLVNKFWMADGTGVTSATLYATTKPTTNFNIVLQGRYMAKNAASSSKALDITTANALDIEWVGRDAKTSTWLNGGYEFDGAAVRKLYFIDYEFTIYASNWSSTVNSGGYYTNTMNMPGVITSYSKPDIALTASSGNTLPTAAETAAYNLIDYFYIPDDISAQSITAYAKTKPTADFVVHVKGVWIRS